MDRTSRIGVFICIVLLIGLQVTMDRLYPPAPVKLHPATTTAPGTTGTTAGTTTPQQLNPEPTPPIASAPVPEQLSVLEDPAIKVTLTSNGAAIKQIELKHHKEGDGNVILNKDSNSNIMALSGWAEGASFQGTEIKTGDDDSHDGVNFITILPGGLKWQRTYTFEHTPESNTGMSGWLRRQSHNIGVYLGQPDKAPLIYNLNVKDSLTNTNATDTTLPAYSLSLGRAQPLLVDGHYQSISNMYTGAGWFTTKLHLTTINDFNPGFIPLIGIKTHDGKDMFTSTSVEDAPIRWVGVENQFFTVLLTPSTDRLVQHASFQCYNQRDSNGSVASTVEPKIETTAFFPEVKVPAGQTVTLEYGLYTGPKDFNQLDALGADQGELMNYDGVLPFSLLIVPMLTVLHFWYMIFHNYGIAIILLTLIIKAITWPLQSIANRSGKRMQALAPKLKELQARHKDHPEKLQTETFALYREYGVNPFGGCLPALVQMPVFFSLYFMLQNAVELRGQSFLWINDLTQPDSLFLIPFGGGYHFSLNLLPILVTGLTMVMMRLTPQIGDPQQAKIAQWMPLVFLFIFYNFAAALSLYYVINNCVSIIQIYRNVRKPLPELKRIPRKKKD